MYIYIYVYIYIYIHNICICKIILIYRYIYLCASIVCICICISIVYICTDRLQGRQLVLEGGDGTKGATKVLKNASEDVRSQKNVILLIWVTGFL